MTVLDEGAMVALRVGATLAYALPTVRLRVRTGCHTLLDVHRPPFPEDTAAAPAVPPCAFRRSVAAAHTRRMAGEELSFLGLATGRAPAVDIGLAGGDRSLPGDLLRVTLGKDWLHVFATTLPMDRAKAAAGDGVRTGPSRYDDEDPDRPRVRVGFHRDDATDVTLVHVATAIGALAPARRALDALEGVYARCAVAELEDHLMALS